MLYFRESIIYFEFMFLDSSGKVVGNTNVENTVALVCHNIYIIVLQYGKYNKPRNKMPINYRDCRVAPDNDMNIGSSPTVT